MKLEKNFLLGLIEDCKILEENQWYEQRPLFGQWNYTSSLFVFQYKEGKRHYTDGDILEHNISENGYTGISCRLVKWE